MAIQMHLALNLFLVFLIGASLGFFGGLFGIGGGIIAVPLLAIGFGMDQALAQGTALVLMVPNLLIGWWRYSKRHPVKLQAVLAISISATLTTWGIAHLATKLDPHLLRWAFSAFLCILAIRMFSTSKTLATNEERPLDVRFLPLIGAVGGSSMGLLGIGGGLVASPLISGWLGQRQTTAQGLALALVAPSSVVALATYAQAARVDWALGLPMAVGGLFTVSAGVALAHRLPERKMRVAFSVILLATASWLLASTLI
jgi:uncharacterized protein